MHILTHSRKFHRFTTNAQTAQAKHFRFYDCLDRGYVIMTDGKVVGIVDTIVQAEQFAINYTNKVWCFNCYGVCIARMAVCDIYDYNKRGRAASEKIASWRV